MNNKKIFSARLKRVRKELGWTQAETCRRTGANYNTYVQWERGLTTPTPYVQELIIKDIEEGGFKYNIS